MFLFACGGGSKNGLERWSWMELCVVSFDVLKISWRWSNKDSGGTG